MLTQLTLFTEFLPLVFCLIFFRKLEGKALKVFFVYTVILSLFTLGTFLSFYYYHSNSAYLVLVRVFSLFEATTVSGFFIIYIANKFFRWFVISGLVIFFAFTFYGWANSRLAISQSLIFEFLFFLVVIVIFLFHRMQTIVAVSISTTISFWIAVGFFVYFAGNFFYVLFTKQSNDEAFKTQMRIIYGVVTIAKNLFISFSLMGSEKLENVNKDLIEVPNNIDLDSFSPNHR